MKPAQKKRSIVLLSGGIDSASCAHFLLSRGHDVHGLWIDYGQLASKQEQTSSLRVAAHLGIPRHIITMSGFADLGVGEHLGRNAMFVNAAMMFGGRQTSTIALGIHAGTQYYDCSAAFLRSITQLVSELTDGATTVVAPFVDWQKAEVVEYFRTTCIPISFTYSCEIGTIPPCGKCLSCLDRTSLSL